MRRHSQIGVAFTDLLFNALLGFVVMFMLALLLVNPIAKSGAIDPKAEFLITMTCTLVLIRTSKRWVHYQGGFR